MSEHYNMIANGFAKVGHHASGDGATAFQYVDVDDLRDLFDYLTSHNDWLGGVPAEVLKPVRDDRPDAPADIFDPLLDEATFYLREQSICGLRHVNEPHLPRVVEAARLFVGGHQAQANAILESLRPPEPTDDVKGSIWFVKEPGRDWRIMTLEDCTKDSGGRFVPDPKAPFGERYEPGPNKYVKIKPDNPDYGAIYDALFVSKRGVRFVEPGDANEPTPPAPERAHAKTDSDKPSRNLRRIDFNTPYDFNTPDPLIDGVLPASGVGILYGPSGIGKSFVALSMAHAIASGRPWGERETQHGAVLYMMAEGSQDGILKRLEALRQRYKDCPADVPLRVLHGSVSLAAGGQADMELLIDEAKVLAEESGQPVKLIVVDTLAASTPGSDENSTDDMKDLMWRLQEVSRATGCAVMAIHHTGKDKEAGMRGSSVIKGSADFVLAINGTGEGFGEVIGEKMRDDGKEAPIQFRLQTLSLGSTHTGRAVSSCVAEVIADGQRDFGVSVDISGDAAEAIQVLEQAQQAIAENEGIDDWRSVPVDWQMWCEGYHSKKSKAKLPTWSKLKRSYLAKRLSQLRAELAAANRVWGIKPANPTDAWQYRASDPSKPADPSGVGVFSE